MNKIKVEITDGWDGVAVNEWTKIFDDRSEADSYIRISAMKNHWTLCDSWCINNREDHLVVNFGSNMFFARLTEVEE